jgi:osmoprotectant transport system ATP-binding protein
MAGVAAIEFEHVSFGRPGGPPVLVDLTLSIADGEVLALVGRSGAGKTTLLKLVNRLLLPDAGGVIVRGLNTRDADPIRLRRSIGYVIQDAGLFPHLSVADNISVVPRLERWPPDRTAARVAELLELVGLPASSYSARWPAELSGGQRQRVGVARALAADPAILLMDEPFGALDSITRADLHDEFRRIQSRVRKTVILVTHDLAEALTLGDRVGVLDAGRLIACDTPAALRASDAPEVRRLLGAVLVR